ncbi:metallophosphoesterase [Myxococcota bacterium]|nr:metallophosphoesterase [Myxococcota bacterium]
MSLAPPHDTGRPVQARPYRLAHFGDLHLRRVDELDEVLALVDDAGTRGAAHLVFTGDVVDAAETEVVEALFDALAARGLGEGGFSFVPGNHDIYPLSWPPTLRGVAETVARRARRKWAHLEALAARESGSAHTLVEGETFPFLRALAPGIVLVGLDSTCSRSRDPRDWAAGMLEREAVDAARAAVAAVEGLVHCVVALHHYPRNDFASASPHFPMEFRTPDARGARQWLRAIGATTILCGHLHDDRERRISGGIGVLCTDSTLDGATTRGYRLVDLHARGGVRTRLVRPKVR